jgi:hypothetical protein
MAAGTEYSMQEHLGHFFKTCQFSNRIVLTFLYGSHSKPASNFVFISQNEVGYHGYESDLAFTPAMPLSACLGFTNRKVGEGSG